MLKLYEVLRAADIQATSEKMIRKTLAGHFGGLDLSDKRALIREHVSGSNWEGRLRRAGWLRACALFSRNALIWQQRSVLGVGAMEGADSCVFKCICVCVFVPASVVGKVYERVCVLRWCLLCFERVDGEERA